MSFDVCARKHIGKSMHDVTICSNLSTFSCGETKIAQKLVPVWCLLTL